jgi:5-formyltetrahydrofolate cyclo-ligase
LAKEQPVLTDPFQAKRWLRRYLTEIRKGIKAERRSRLSAAVIRHLVGTDFYKRSKTVALFIGFGSEVATDALIRRAWSEGKRVLIPTTAKGFARPGFTSYLPQDRLIRTSYGPLELEPRKVHLHAGQIDLILVPGLGFDEEGYRLGYGGGVYDRLLKKAPKARHVGLFFDLQRLHALPRERHDRPLEAVVTDKGVFSTVRSPAGLA